MTPPPPVVVRVGEPGGDPEGPIVAVCTGQRCTALLELRDSAPALDGLRAGVRRTPGAILVSTGCLHRCDLAAAVLVGWNGSHAPPVVLSGMDSPARMAALASWLPGPGPAATVLAGEPLPGQLASAAEEARPSL